MSLETSREVGFRFDTFSSPMLYQGQAGNGLGERIRMFNVKLSGLPELRFDGSQLGEGSEVYFDPQGRLGEVLIQGNPVYLVLDPPHMQTSIVVCFPIPNLVRVYVLHQNDEEGIQLIGQAGDGGQFYQVPREPVRYRFGMRLTPWMFGSFLRQEHRARIQDDNIVHYPVLACFSGYGGALIRVFRSPTRHPEEWIEIYYFSSGNEYLFKTGWKADRQTRLIARFRPAATYWMPEPSPAW